MISLRGRSHSSSCQVSTSTCRCTVDPRQYFEQGRFRHSELVFPAHRGDNNKLRRKLFGNRRGPLGLDDGGEHALRASSSEKIISVFISENDDFRKSLFLLLSIRRFTGRPGARARNQ